MTDHSLELSVIESILGERCDSCSVDSCLGHWKLNGHKLMVLDMRDGTYLIEKLTSQGRCKRITQGDFEHLISKITDPKFRKTL